MQLPDFFLVIFYFEYLNAWNDCGYLLPVVQTQVLNILYLYINKNQDIIYIICCYLYFDIFNIWPINFFKKGNFLKKDLVKMI